MSADLHSLQAVWPAFLEGFALSLGLIVAIGPQNAFVLRQGLRREFVGIVVLVCASSDAVLITAGVFGVSEILRESTWLATSLAVAGTTFLAWYGWKALKRAQSPGQLLADHGGKSLGLSAVTLQAAAFTLLNPHVYLDTVLLAGSLGAQQPIHLQGWFVTGAAVASACWFGSLGFGARWLAPWFEHPKAWQFLDGFIGLTMWCLALLMLRRVIIGF
jgi:L-lysine exporter family protein LysE/ArgO